MAVLLSFPASPRVAGSGKRPPEKAVLAETRKNASREDIEAEYRKAMLGKVHIQLNELYGLLDGFTDDVYRFTLQERWGVGSSGDMDRRQLHELLLWLKGLRHAHARDVAAARNRSVRPDRSVRPSRRGRARSDAPGLLRHDPAGLGREPLMARIEALLAEIGLAENRYVSWSYALGTLKKSSGGVINCWEHTRAEDLGRVIAALTRTLAFKNRAGSR